MLSAYGMRHKNGGTPVESVHVRSQDIEHDVDFSHHVKKRCSLNDFDHNVQVAHRKPSEWYYRGTFLNETMQHWMGGPLVHGNRQVADNHIQYKDPATDDWDPVPPGYYALLPGDCFGDNGEL